MIKGGTLSGFLWPSELPPPDYSKPHYGGLAVDAAGNCYAAVTLNGSVYKFDPTGGSTIVFDRSKSDFLPKSLAVDADGHLLMTEATGRIGRLEADGSVTILAGAAGVNTHRDGFGSEAYFGNPAGIAVDQNGTIYVTSSSLEDNTIREGVLEGPPTITVQPLSQSVAAGGAIEFSVTVTAAPEPTYQWYRDGTAIDGATSETLSLESVNSGNAGSYTVTVTNDLGSVTSDAATLSVTSSTSGGSGSTSSSSSSGGGGAPSWWFVAAIAVLIGVREGRRRYCHVSQ